MQYSHSLLLVIALLVVYGTVHPQRLRLLQNNVKCKSDEYLSNNTCIKCNASLPNCISCTNSTYCTACVPGTILANGVCSVIESAPVPVPAPTPIGCTDTNCALCPAAPGTCVTCNRGYFFNAKSTCQACAISNCKRCPNDVCTFCEDGYYRTAEGSCEACYETCKGCFGVGEFDCAACYTGATMKKIAGTGSGSCECPAGSQFDSEQKACIKDE